MNTVKSFSDFNIITERFVGKKISIEDVLDVKIKVLDFKIEPSKRYAEKGNGLMLTLQIIHEEIERIVFTGSVILQEQCEKVRLSGEFPFIATIVAIKPRGFKFI